MRLLDRILKTEGRTSPENPATPLGSPASWLVSLFGGGSTQAGVEVSHDGSLAIAAFWCAQRVLAEGIAGLPFEVFERTGARTSRKAKEHRVHRLIHDAPNEDLTSFVWREVSMGHATGWGNWYTELKFDRAGQLQSMHPILPQTAQATTRNGRWYLVVRDPGLRVLPSEQVLRVPGYGFDGVQGYDPVAVHRENLGLAIATKQYGASWFGNAARPSGVVEHPKQLGKEAAETLKLQLEQTMTGQGNWNRLAVLEEGMTFRAITVNPDAAQFLGTSGMSVLEVARITLVRPHLLMDLSQAKYANVEQSAIDHVMHTIRPWAVRIEQEANLKLFTERERGRYYVKLNLDGLLRGDLATRYNAYATARQWGWLNADDVRHLEDMDQLPDDQGTHYLVPMNMIPASQLDAEPPAPPAAPAPPAPDDDQADGDGTGRSLPACSHTGRTAPAQRAVLSPSEVRAVGNRRRLQRSFRRLLREVGVRITKRETDNVRGAITRYLAKGQEQAFRDWLHKFFQNHAQHVLRTAYPVLGTYAEEMAKVCADETNSSEPVDLERFALEYTETFSVRHANSREAQLAQLLDQADDTDDAAHAIGGRLEEWTERTPDKIANRESKQAGNALAKAAFAASGVQLLRWTTSGENCDLCDELDGRIVGIQQNFVNIGDTVNADGPAPLKAAQGFGHPPLHQGCDCDIVPN